MDLPSSVQHIQNYWWIETWGNFGQLLLPPHTAHFLFLGEIRSYFRFHNLSFFYHQLTSFCAHRKWNYCISISGVPFSQFKSKAFQKYQHFDEWFRFTLILKTSEIIITIPTKTGSPNCISIFRVPFSHFWEVVGEAVEMMMMWWLIAASIWDRSLIK